MEREYGKGGAGAAPPDKGRTSIQARQATPEDWPALSTLLHRAELQDCLDPREVVYAGLREDRTFLAFAGDEVVGAIQFQIRRKPFAHLRLLAVRHTAQSEPVVAALLAAACQAALDAGAEAWRYLAPPGPVGEALRHQGFRLVEEVVELEKEDYDIPSRGNRALRLRPAREVDFPALLALDAAAFTPFWRNDLGAFQEYLRGGYTFLAAELAGQVVGYLVAEDHPAGFYIIRLAVDPAWQGQGVGTRLLAETIALAKARATLPILLNTQRTNRRARRLYAWFGFRPSGRVLWAWTRALAQGGAPVL
ncbi:MAG: GNAT family N-acetyltransferase [Anaerolineae bacterium]